MEKFNQGEDSRIESPEETIKILEQKLAEAERKILSLRAENENQKKIFEEDMSAADRKINILELKGKNKAEFVKKIYEELETDYKTGINNHRYFEKRAGKIIAIINRMELQEKRQESALPLAASIAVVDIDHFKKINDTKGHLEGDRILRIIAQLLKQNVRDTDIVCRWGGEEFAILFINAGLKNAYEKCEELRKIIEKDTGVTVSIGVSEYEKGLSLEKVFERSDGAVYLSKNTGRNRVSTYEQVKEADEKAGKKKIEK